MDQITLSRRNAFKIAGFAGMTAALARTGVARADAPATLPAALPQGAGFYRAHVGEFEITVVSDGQFPLTPYPTIGSNASEEAVHAVLKDNFLDPAKIMGQVNVLLVRKNGGPVTVVDTGSGKLFGPAAGFAKQNLAAAGVVPSEVQTVVFTHLHPDHVGGAVGEDGAPAFTNAKHWVHKVERDFWAGPSPDLSKSGVPEAMRGGMVTAAKKAIDALGDKLGTFDGDSYEIAPGFTAHRTGGHTPGHCTLKFESDGDSLVYVTDLVVQSVLCLAHPEWLVGFDTDMNATIGIRQKLYADLAESRTLVSGSHLPFPSVGHVKKADPGYAFVSAPWLWALIFQGPVVTNLSDECLLEHLHWRYACKVFDPAQTIPPLQWRTIEEAFRLAPSSYGVQPWHFVVISDPAVKAKLPAISHGQKQPAESSHVVVVAVRRDYTGSDLSHLIDRMAAVSGKPLDALAGFRKTVAANTVDEPDRASIARYL